MSRLLTAAALLLLVACPAEKTPPEPTPIGAPSTRLETLAQPGVDALVEEGVDAYQAWRIDWTGMQPKVAVLERYRRGTCYERGRFELGAGGNLQRAEVEAVAEGEGAAPEPTALVITALTRAAAEKSPEDLPRSVDAAGRLTWAYRKHGSGEGPDIETIHTVTYEPADCTLPALVPRLRVPPKQAPSGVAP